MRNFHQKVTSCRNKISSWKKQNPTNSALLIKELKHKIDMSQDDEFTTTEELEDLRRQLILAFREENTFWEQKSRDQWHKDGDRNTKIPSCHYKTTKSPKSDN